MFLESDASGFVVRLQGQDVIRHSTAEPWLFAGRGEPRVSMQAGNFDVQDYVIARAPLGAFTVTQSGSEWCIDFGALRVRITGTSDTAQLHFEAQDTAINRVWIRLVAEPGEAVWGGGEQFSFFDLRGRRFPLWTGEPGVGRDLSNRVSWQANQAGDAGGDYTRTYYPQPSFISSRSIAVHLDTTAFTALDFRHPAFHELECWMVPRCLELWSGTSPASLVESLSARFGRPPALPDWTDRGAIIGLKDGTRSFERLDRMIAAGVQVSGLWCEDWAGVRRTAFGTRLFWNWEWSAERYPELPRRIAELKQRDIRFLAYANPYLCTDGPLFAEADALRLCVRNGSAESYRLDFGGFTAGIVDFTNPEAGRWFVERILRRNLLDLDIAGWMADFGEYLPADAILANGDAMLLHNAWPVLWAELNAQAVAEAERVGDALFFMRAGFTGVQRYCPLLWGGDQSVDFSRHDGLPSAVCAALSSGMMGNPYHHTDVGGYTSLFGNRRTPELLMRWAEMAAFAAVMRTHEGNRPHENLQVDSSPGLLAHFARMTVLYRHLAPYRRALVADAVARGLPLQRALCLEFPHDAEGYGIQDQFLLGPDLLIAPVQAEGARDWSVYLPAGAAWCHVWTGAEFAGGRRVTVRAGLGEPPVFYRRESSFEVLFRQLARYAD